MSSNYNSKFELLKISEGYELIYHDVETGVTSKLKLMPDRVEDFCRKLQLVRMLVKTCVLEVTHFKNDFEMQEMFCSL